MWNNVMTNVHGNKTRSFHFQFVMKTFPDWATPGENRKLFGNARALGADDLTLSDRDATLGYVEQKSAGKLNVFSYYFSQGICETINDFIYFH